MQHLLLQWHPFPHEAGAVVRRDGLTWQLAVPVPAVEALALQQGGAREGAPPCAFTVKQLARAWPLALLGTRRGPQ